MASRWRLQWLGRGNMEQLSLGGRFRLSGSARGGALRWELTDNRAGRLYAVASRRDGKDLADHLLAQEGRPR